jgi:hypothetical protein
MDLKASAGQMDQMDEFLKELPEPDLKEPRNPPWKYKERKGGKDKGNYKADLEDRKENHRSRSPRRTFCGKTTTGSSPVFLAYNGSQSNSRSNGPNG